MLTERADNSYHQCFLSKLEVCYIMSVNDKVQVIWKTQCEWRDHPHWFKRKEIKLTSDPAGRKDTPLNPGDAVKVKFGYKWYDAEVVESWQPKSQKGNYLK